MGTNFYLHGYRSFSNMDPTFHIGKRSAAGLYCWDCRLTLCKWGEGQIHTAKVVLPPDAPTRGLESLAAHFKADREQNWHATCPRCGAAPAEESLSNNAAGRELGFNTGPLAAKRGVASCSSFSWAMPRERLAGRRVVYDEYDRRSTLRQFLDDVLAECPVQYFDSVGQWFC